MPLKSKTTLPIKEMYVNVCAERDELLEALEQLVHYVAPSVQSEGRLSQGLSSALVQARAVIGRVK